VRETVGQGLCRKAFVRKAGGIVKNDALFPAVFQLVRAVVPRAELGQGQSEIIFYAAQNAGVGKPVALVNVPEIPVSVEVDNAEAAVFLHAGADGSVRHSVFASEHDGHSAAAESRGTRCGDAFLNAFDGPGAVDRLLRMETQSAGSADAVPGLKLLGRFEQGGRAV